MKRGTSVKVVDSKSPLFGKTGKFVFKANENHAHVAIDGGNVVTLHRLQFEPINVYTPPIVNESNTRLKNAIHELYEEAKMRYDIAVKFDSDYARGQANTAKLMMDGLKNILDGKY